jgi:radical SAM superfamily enzyme YgiQ (UPF0313 family)
MKINLIAFQEVEHTGFENGENIEIGRVYAFLRNENFNPDYIYLERKNMPCNFEEYIGINIVNVYNTTIDYAFQLVKEVKRIYPQSVFLLFSRFVTEAAELALEECPQIDGILLGHPELPLLNLLNAIKNGEDIYHAILKNEQIMSFDDRIGKQVKEVDINLLPVPDRTTLYEKRATIAYINTSHGCAGNCSFCGMFYKDRWTGRPAQDIFHEIISIYEKTGIRIFIFEDASFEDKGGEGKNKLFELCKLLITYPVKFSFRCFMRTESFQETEADISLLKELKKAGFVNILWGIEAGNEKDLRLYQKRATLTDNNRIQKLLSMTGHDFLYGFIMMNPYSTLETLTANIDYLHSILCSHLEYYVSSVRLWYNTPLYVKLKKDDLLIDNQDYKNYYNYHYMDRKVEIVSDFISKEFDFHSEIMRNDYEEYHFEQFLRYLKHIFGKEVDDFSNELKGYQIELAETMFSYFKSVYKRLDIDFAKENINVFKESLCLIYKQIKRLKFKVIKFYAKKQR